MKFVYDKATGTVVPKPEPNNRPFELLPTNYDSDGLSALRIAAVWNKVTPLFVIGDRVRSRIPNDKRLGRIGAVYSKWAIGKVFYDVRWLNVGWYGETKIGYMTDEKFLVSDARKEG
jgi:hypothetical protein